MQADHSTLSPAALGRAALGAAAGRLAAVRETFSTEHRTIGAAALRIMLGATTLMMYALHFQQRAFLWGDRGVFPRDVNATFLALRNSWSVYNIGSSETLHALIFVAGMIVTALFTVGFMTRITSVLFFVFTFSLYTRNEILLDGGNNLLMLIAFFLMFVDVSGRRIPSAATGAPAQNRYLALLHNLGVLAIIGQISILYFTSAWAKMMGHMWQDGTAIYYVLRTAEFHLSPLTDFLIQNPLIVVVATYATIILQVGFPFMIWNKTLKYPWILAACSFHIGIAYFMGLVWFSLTMLSCELILVSDHAYLGVWREAKSAFTWLRLTYFGRGRAAAPAVVTERAS
jgi:hypothetical protein